MAAAKENRYAKNATLIRQAFKKALARSDGSVTDGLIKIADSIINKAKDGDIQSATAIFDRLAGRPHQSVDATVEHTVTDLNDSLLLTEKLTGQLKNRVGEPAEPPKRTLQ